MAAVARRLDRAGRSRARPIGDEPWPSFEEGAIVALPLLPCRKFHPATSTGRAKAIGCTRPKSASRNNFLCKVRSDPSEPGYERLIMKVFGITKLRAEPAPSSKHADCCRA